MSSISDPQVERIDALFVQSATAFSSGPGTITLHGLADSTVYFADRPRREIGHIPSHRFVELWEAGAEQLRGRPAECRALVPRRRTASRRDDAVVVLREPRLEDGHALLQRRDPRRHAAGPVGPCALFIDVFGRPLAPVGEAPARRSQGG